MKTHDKYLNERRPEGARRDFSTDPLHTNLLMRKDTMSDWLKDAIDSHFFGDERTSKQAMKEAEKIFKEIKIGLKNTKPGK